MSYHLKFLLAAVTIIFGAAAPQFAAFMALLVNVMLWGAHSGDIFVFDPRRLMKTVRKYMWVR